jgi:hypothetical protein
MREIKKIQRNQQTTQKMSRLSVQAKSTNHVDIQAVQLSLDKSKDANKDNKPTYSMKDIQGACDTNTDHSKTETNFALHSASTDLPTYQNDSSPASIYEDSMDGSNLLSQRRTC